MQLLLHPVSTILASLRSRAADGTTRLHTFEGEQLVDVVAALDGPTLRPPLFGRPEPRPGTWGPQLSLEGRSTAPDGSRETLTVEVRTDEFDFDLFARFDAVDVKGPDGVERHL